VRGDVGAYSHVYENDVELVQCAVQLVVSALLSGAGQTGCGWDVAAPVPSSHWGPAEWQAAGTREVSPPALLDERSDGLAR
jgi:hypothetical protein